MGFIDGRLVIAFGLFLNVALAAKQVVVELIR